MPLFDQAADDPPVARNPDRSRRFPDGRYWARTSDLLLVREPAAVARKAGFAGHSPVSATTELSESSSRLQALFGTLVHGNRCVDQRRGHRAAGSPRGNARSEGVNARR